MPFEVLISDDASTDGTAHVINAWVARSPLLKTFRQSIRLGWVGNTNFLLARASGDFVVILPHDDVLEPEYLRSLYEGLTSNANAVLAFSDIRDFGDCYAPCRWGALPLAGSQLLRLIRCMMTPNQSLPHRGLLRADIARKVGGLPSSRFGSCGAEVAFLWKVAAFGETVRLPFLFYHKRRFDSLRLPPSLHERIVNRLAAWSMQWSAIGANTVAPGNRIILRVIMILISPITLLTPGRLVKVWARLLGLRADLGKD